MAYLQYYSNPSTGASGSLSGSTLQDDDLTPAPTPFYAQHSSTATSSRPRLHWPRVEILRTIDHPSYIFLGWSIGYFHGALLSLILINMRSTTRLKDINPTGWVLVVLNIVITVGYLALSLIAGRSGE
jgi:hypothetical protein